MDGPIPDAAAALHLWRDFPVAVQPRPLVLVGDAVLVDGGFDSDAAKIAYLQGAVDDDGLLPPEVREVMLPHMGGPSPMRLGVTGVGSTTGRFLTDRGLCELPAWEVRLTHLSGAVTVLSPAPRSWSCPSRSAARSPAPSGWPSPSDAR